ncbi:DUF2591 family protein (plasmid) [Escherichia coli]|nr:DUF2591 family protein [Escherichia coli]MBA8354073.1 DUF2591 family protein [Escherichia coli]
MNYSQLSDFEINRMVGDIIFKGLWACRPETSGNNTNKWYYGNADTSLGPLNSLPDYCNAPADAWPIIIENKINIVFFSNGSLAQFYQYGEESVEYAHVNPLRAAMIVFLMMKESEI